MITLNGFIQNVKNVFKEPKIVEDPKPIIVEYNRNGKIKRRKPHLTDEQKKVIVELHKTTALKVIAKKIDVPYQWAYKWSVENGLELKYCRKVEKSSKQIVNNNASVFDWSNFANGETLFLTGVPNSEIEKDLNEPKDANFLKTFPNFGKKGYDLYYQKISRK